MNIKTALKAHAHGLRKAYARVRSFDDRELLSALRRIGVESGDVILVHSSLDALAGYEGKPSDLIRVLGESVGSTGTVAMPTIPFSGTAVEYARSGQVFDVARTPSRVGMLTEIFRRTPGTTRSLHPTHPVAASGHQAAEMLSDHRLSETPCDAVSPFGRLLEMKGMSVFLGAPLDSMTFFHHIECVLEPQMPFSPFTAEHFEFRCKDASGREVIVRSRLFEPAVSRRRSLRRLAREMHAQRTWRQTQIGTATLLAIGAEDALAAARAMAARGEYCYED